VNQSRLFPETDEPPPPLPPSRAAAAQSIDDAVEELARTQLEGEGVKPFPGIVAARCGMIKRSAGGVKFALARRRFIRMASMSAEMEGVGGFDASLLKAQRDLDRAEKVFTKTWRVA
jgi:hypothetical protein